MQSNFYVDFMPAPTKFGRLLMYAILTYHFKVADNIIMSALSKYLRLHRT